MMLAGCVVRIAGVIRHASRYGLLEESAQIRPGSASVSLAFARGPHGMLRTIRGARVSALAIVSADLSEVLSASALHCWSGRCRSRVHTESDSCLTGGPLCIDAFTTNTIAGDVPLLCGTGLGLGALRQADLAAPRTRDLRAAIARKPLAACRHRRPAERL